MKQMGLKGFIVILVGVMAGMCSGCAFLPVDESGRIDTDALIALVSSAAESTQIMLATYLSVRDQLAMLDDEGADETDHTAERAARRAELLLELDMLIEMADRSGLSDILRSLDADPFAADAVKNLR